MGMAAGGRSVACFVVAILPLAAMAAAVSGGGGAAAEVVWPPAPHAVVAKIRPRDCRGVAYAHCHGTIGEAIKDEAAAAGTGANKGHEPRLVILITTGVYEEQVNITRRNVVLLGEGRGKTIISGNLSNLTGTEMYQTATVSKCSGLVSSCLLLIVDTVYRSIVGSTSVLPLTVV